MIKFRFLTGDVNYLQYGAKWVSKELNNGEFPYFLVLELINMDDACGRDSDGQFKYNVSLSAVSPQEAGEHGLKQAVESCGVGDGSGIPDLMKVEALHGYGIYAHLWQKDGNNAHALLKEARQQADQSIDEVLSRTVNKIGTTGLEALRGDITAGLTRTIASGSVEGNILAKMHGIADAPPPPDQGAGPKQE